MLIRGHEMDLNLEIMESSRVSSCLSEVSTMTDGDTVYLSIISRGSVPFKRQGWSCRGVV